MFEDYNKFSFRITDTLKTSKPGKPQLTIHVNAYPDEVAICPFICLKAFIHISKDLRTDSKLFIGWQKPHKKIGSQTISRWIALGLKEAGIDDKFKSHSVRHASCSKAVSSIPISDILRTVGWSREQTFAVFYRRETLDNGERFTNSVLQTGT
jgi:hypothetical protein